MTDYEKGLKKKEQNEGFNDALYYVHIRFLISIIVAFPFCLIISHLLGYFYEDIPFNIIAFSSLLTILCVMLISLKVKPLKNEPK